MIRESLSQQSYVNKSLYNLQKGVETGNLKRLYHAFTICINLFPERGDFSLAFEALQVWLRHQNIQSKQASICCIGSS